MLQKQLTELLDLLGNRRFKEDYIALAEEW